MTPELITLRTNLLDLKHRYGFVALKGGTETEDMTPEEIQLLHEIGKGILPVVVKIGGPEARTDIRTCEKIGVEGISAPMIESEYSLRNFVDTLRNLLHPSYWDSVIKSINLETITGYRNLLEISESPAFALLHQVTAARSDLSSSMNLKPDDKEVTKVTKAIVKLSKERGKKTSVGGTITKYNFGMICDEISPDYINSRHIMVDSKMAHPRQYEEIAESMLLFEMELYHAFSQLNSEKVFYYQKRIETNRERIGERKVVYFIR